MTEPLFSRIHHVCIVVSNLEQARTYYEGLGITGWYDYPKGVPYLEYEVPNPEGSAKLKYACVDLENIQLQLCEPGAEDTPQRRFLDERGEGVYHLGFEVPELQAALETAAGFGLSRLAYGIRDDNSGFCYFDTRKEAGTVLEVRVTAPASQVVS